VIDVNLAPLQVGAPGMVAQFRQILARTGAPADRLRLEITERAVIDDLRTGAPVMHDLHAIGLRLAVEDFGEAACSLAVLCDLPIDLLKIDQQFIANLDGNPRVRAVVRGMITMAHDLGSIVTFEQIETAAQRDTATRLGCDAGQGFFLAAPMPANAATAWLDERLR
jgi:EAL domain-containing protein (putative c-di-GMP-specific phosphodiesterase class I)